LQIESYSHPDPTILAQVRSLEYICQTNDQLKGRLFLDSSLNFSREMPCLLAMVEEGVLIGAMTLFAPSREEVELVGLTHPDFRRRGVFRSLLSTAAELAKSFGIPELLFVCEPQSQEGIAALTSFGVELDHVEYSLRYDRDFALASLAVPEGLVLERATEAELNDMSLISADSFSEEAEHAQRFLELAIHSDTRTQFLARLNGEPVAIGAIGVEDGEATIYGLGVLPRLQGKGIGRGVIALLLREIFARGMEDILIEVDNTNATALHLYLTCGFLTEATFGYFRAPVSQFLAK